jgi:low affinity Fe/Cu permease
VTTSRGSRPLHAIDRLTSQPVIAWTLLSLDLAWVVLSVAFGFPSRIETIFQTLVAALTLALVFVIQHTQAREQLVTQRKLDEILRALPRADNAVIGLEDASDTQLASLHDDHRQLRQKATEPSTG